jgi:NADPH:quinone reductase-like Zn-dependent oxidoreductase
MLRLIVAIPEVAKPVVDRVFPWEEAAQAYEYLEAQKHVGKVVIRVAKD